MARTKVRKNTQKISAAQISDFRYGIDKVIRLDGRTYVVGPDYAPAEVLSDELTEEVKTNLRTLSPENRRKMASVTRMTPFLSEEGRQERQDYLAELEKGSV
jgi:hypothetical protein